MEKEEKKEEKKEDIKEKFKKKKDKFKKSSSKFISDFKKFAFKGNIVDLAIAVIIGTAFSKIISSLVADIIMPCIGMLIGNVDLSDLKIVFKQGDTLTETPETALRYGLFLQTIIEFLIIALSIYIAFRVIMRIKKLSEKKQNEQQQAAPPAPLPLSKTDELLTDIKQLLTEQNEKKAKTKNNSLDKKNKNI